MSEANGADAVLGHVLLAFEGTDLSPATAGRLAARPAAGATLFRHLNVVDPGQLRALTDAIQRLAPPGSPFLVGIDQEGGQLRGLGPESTPFAGNMALGAADDVGLAERVARAIGLELRACGVNVNYAPVCDLATNPANPSVGVRSFGDDPDRVAPLVAAFVRGHVAAGVAATLKHFPGNGGAALDSHHQLAALDASRERLVAAELAPFRAGIAAGASLVMSGHVAVPALTGRPDLPATLARSVMHDLLRDELDFSGVAVSDAFDMAGLGAGDARAALAADGLNAGLDLILSGPADAGRADLEDALLEASARGAVDPAASAAALARVAALRSRVADVAQPELDIVGSAEHRALARELAERSLTLVRDTADLLPLPPAPEASIAVVMPRPTDITPADTSSAERAGLASAIRRRHTQVTEHVVAPDPDDAEIAAVVSATRGEDLLVVATAAASLQPGQSRLARALLATGRPTVTVALRTPWDLLTYPESTTHACTYSLLEPSLEALAGALFGERGFPGRLPVRIDGLDR
jgi:beta-N-acetylhexosaminidase